MEKHKTIYKKSEWTEFSSKVKKRDNNKCVKCNRSGSEVTLQVHHYHTSQVACLGNITFQIA